MLSHNVFGRIFYLQCGTRRGTGFTLDVDGLQYLVTATHVIRSLREGRMLELHHQGKWKPLDVALVGTCPPQIDITVLALKFRISLPTFTLEPTMAGLTVGQEACCVGFPSGEWGGGGNLAKDFPTPFVKKVTVSHLPDASLAVRCLYLDGYGNPGFSGGPVVYQRGNTGEWNVAAVVSAFLYQHEPVYLGNDQVHLNVQQNQDFIVSYDIKHAVDLVHLNPIGFQVKE